MDISSGLHVRCTVGIPIFLVNMAVSGWIKFIMYQPAAIVMTVIMSLSLAFLTLTYAQWLSHLILSSRRSRKVSPALFLCPSSMFCQT